MSLEVATLTQGIHLVGQRREIIDSASLAFFYWKQRTKDLHAQFGEIASSFYFRRFRPRKHKTTYSCFVAKMETGSTRC